MAVRQPTLHRVPGVSPLGSYIYVLRFNVGVIKVGFTRKPADRVVKYRSALSPFGITIADLWFSEPHGQAKDNERLLLSFCRTQAKQVRKREYFTGIDFRKVVAFADTLPCIPLDSPPSKPAPYDASLMKYVKVADDIQAHIQQGHLQVGARLPGERELADQYEIAHGTARRVIQELRDRALAQTVPNKGTFIVEPPAGEVYVWRQVADQVAARVSSGELAPGARLAGEQDLAEQYGIARGTARRVVQELRDRGLATTLASKGTYITEPPASSE